MTDWKKDKKWSDRFLPQIKQTLGMYLIGEAPIEEDQKRNTDLIVLKMDSIRIACRVRRYEYYEKYPYEITIRAGRPSGIKTELTKIIEGWGDYFFYGFSDIKEFFLCDWVLCNLNEFRVWFNRQIVKNAGKLPGIEKSNKDNSSIFRAFNLQEMPEDIIFAKLNGRSDDIPF